MTEFYPVQKHTSTNHKKGATEQIIGIELIFTTAVLDDFPQRPGLHRPIKSST